MNGAIDYEDAFMLSIDQREIMSKVIEKHFEAQNPNGGSKLIG